jgi:hypothetical protein
VIGRDRLVNLLGLTMREAERRAVDGMTKVALGAHSPVEVEPGHVVCRLCKGHPPWPCPEVVRLTDRLDALHAQGGSVVSTAPESSRPFRGLRRTT